MPLGYVVTQIPHHLKRVDQGGSHPQYVSFNDDLQIVLRFAVDIIDYVTGDVVEAGREHRDLETDLDVGCGMGLFAMDFLEEVLGVASGDLSGGAGTSGSWWW